MFTTQTDKKVIELNIEQKEFGSQNIKINKYKKKSEDLLRRIYSEKREIINAKKIKYKHYPDINFIFQLKELLPVYMVHKDIITARKVTIIMVTI